MTLTKAQIKSISNLRLKKYRNSDNRFIVEGERGVFDGLNSNHKCEIILVTKNFFENNASSLKEINNLEIVTQNDFSKITETVNPQGIAAVFEKPTLSNDWIKNLNAELAVCLEDVSDPGNVGTIIRNCDWFGINNLILSNNCADVYNPKTIRSSVGSIFHTNVYFSKDLKKDLMLLKGNGYKIFSAALDGKSIFKYKSVGKTIIVFGNEANGITKNILELSDEIINIPKVGKAESLNVANSSAVILAELTKHKFQ